VEEEEEAYLTGGVLCEDVLDGNEVLQ
jgi:hypothetical protein